MAYKMPYKEKTKSWRILKTNKQTNKQINHVWLHQSQTQFDSYSTCYSIRVQKPQPSIFLRNSLKLWLHLICNWTNYSCGMKRGGHVNTLQRIFVLMFFPSGKSWKLFQACKKVADILKTNFSQNRTSVS